MLDGINTRAGAVTVPAPSKATTAPTAKTAGPAAATVVSQSSVVLSITTTTVSVNFSADAADVPPPVPGSAADQAQRGLEALKQITDAKGKAAGTMKQFLRQKLDGLKKQLQVLRILGTDALDIAKGSAKVARDVAGTARDYAAATIAQKKAGLPTDGSDAPSSGDVPTEKEAQQQAQDLQAQAARAPLTTDPSSDNPTDAPTDPDEKFFYDAFRLLNLAKKTLVETQRIDTRLHGTEHAKDFKKLRQREAQMEQAVTEAYKAMKTNGDLKATDALLADTGAGGPSGLSILT